MVTKFSELKGSDLIVNEIYEGGTLPGKASEVLSKVIPGVPNSRGFRFQTKDGRQHLCLLYASNDKSEWQNSFEPSSGLFIYHGDNKEVGVSVKDSTKAGMKFLNRIDEAIKRGNRKDVPPIFVFVKGDKGWDVRFIGLAVPGVKDKQDFLEEVQTSDDVSTVYNYKSIFTVLNVDRISRKWIDDICDGDAYESQYAPSVWKNWVDFNEYSPIEFKVDSFGLDKQNIKDGKPNTVKESNYTSMDTVKHVNQYIESKGFLYSEGNIKNLYLSLISKPFVILSGISGTGKTKIIELFAEALGANYENGRFKLIPVRPDWSDSSDLLGYKDLKNDFIKGPLTEMIIQAAEKAPNHPHFVVLDEMNLARVEYYLSDFLSVVESRKYNGEKIETAPIVEFNGKTYGIPDNLYIIGTVNMDETTHPFSKKVLDRANSIEFNEVDLLNFSIFEQQGEEVAPIEVSNDVFKSKYIQLKDVYYEHEELVNSVSKMLVSINQKLKMIYAQVGYRVRDEIAFYMAYNKEYRLMKQDQAMDYCIMQKILPRISGTGAEIEDVLKELFGLFVNDASISIDSTEDLTLIAKYPLSANKLREMNKRYRSLGFVSFWIS